MDGAECGAQGGSEGFERERVMGDQIREVRARAGGVGAGIGAGDDVRSSRGGGADLRDVAAGAGVTAGQKKEQRDNDVSAGEGGSAELVREQRRVIALHGGDGERADFAAEEGAEIGAEAIAQGGGGGRGAAVIDEDDGRADEAGRMQGFPDTVGKNRGQDAAGGEAVGEVSLEVAEIGAEFFEVAAEGGADGDLGAEEKRDEEELALPEGVHLADEGGQRPRRRAVEGGGGDAVAVLPRDGVDDGIGRAAEGGGESAETAVGGGL